MGALKGIFGAFRDLPASGCVTRPRFAAKSISLLHGSNQPGSINGGEVLLANALLSWPSLLAGDEVFMCHLPAVTAH